MVGNVKRGGEDRNAYRCWVGTLEYYNSLGRPRRGWKDNFKKVIKYVGRLLTGLVCYLIGISGALM
jgi:hypothetical protein